MGTMDREPSTSAEEAILTVAPGKPGALSAVTAMLGNARPARRVRAVETLSEAMKAGTQAPVLVLVSSPVASVARALGRGLPPEQALEQWTTRTRGFIAEVGAVWERVLLLDADTVSAAPGDVAAELGARLGITLDTLPQPQLVAMEPLNWIVAQYLLQTAPEAKDLSDQFSAMVLGDHGARGPGLAGVTQLWAALEKTRQEADEARGALAQARGALRLTAGQVFEFRSQIGADLAEAEKLQRAIREQQCESEEAGARAQQREDALAAQLVELRRESDAIRRSRATDVTESSAIAQRQASAMERGARIYRMQTALERAEKKLKFRGAKIAELQKALKAARQELAGIYNSKSWKAVRVARRAVPRPGRRK